MKYFTCFSIFVSLVNISLSQRPVINNITPSSAITGTPIIITGTGFNTDVTDDILYFGAVKANVFQASQDSIYTAVPAGASFSQLTITTNNLTAYSSATFLPTFAGGSHIRSSSFASQRALSTDLYPRSLVCVDINLDGNPDLICVNNNSNTISIFKNTSALGNISFKKRLTLATGNNPFSVVFADINNDGKIDLIVSNLSDNTLSVYKNKTHNGSFSFDTAINIQTGENPLGLAVGDINNDGKTDIIVVNNNGNSFSVIKNNSTKKTISFEPRKDFATGTWPFFVVAADFTGDGLTDLAVTNYDDNTISVYKNKSTSDSIAFGERHYIAGSSPFGITAADLNNDGKPEIISSNSNEGTISVFENNSFNGYISFRAGKKFNSGYSPLSIKVNDINGDGKPDLVVANFNEDSVSIFQNTSAGDKITLSKSIKYLTGMLPRDIIVQDLNADGKPDLGTVNSGSNTISVFKNVMIDNSSLNKTGINDMAYDKKPGSLLQIKISPDPVKDILNINIANISVPGKIHIEVIDVNGKVLIKEDQYASKTLNTYHYNCSSLSAGIYSVKIILADGRQSKINFLKL